MQKVAHEDNQPLPPPLDLRLPVPSVPAGWCKLGGCRSAWRPITWRKISASTSFRDGGYNAPWRLTPENRARHCAWVALRPRAGVGFLEEIGQRHSEQCQFR